jgi:hypothetical protein
MLGAGFDRQRRVDRLATDRIVVGNGAIDLMAGQALLVELKAAKAWDEAHHAQCLDY